MNPNIDPQSLQLQSITPFLTVNDLQTSLAWYRDVLGFTVAEEYKMEDKVVGVRLEAGAVQLMLGQDDFAKGRDRVKGTALRFYYQTDRDIDALAAAIRERGGKLTQEPTDQPWGRRDFAVVDPDGFNISIASDVRR
jgi:lactoylglutathione lyase